LLKGLNKWEIMNSKRIKTILKISKEQWGTDLSELSTKNGFLEGSDGDIFLISRDIEKLDLDNLRLNSLGLYIGQLRHDNLRLSIEGSQIIGKSATKNIVEINDEEFSKWLKGEILQKKVDENTKGYVLMKYGKDFVGCGRAKNGEILNFIPKARRITNQ
jgi:NOL1/NOP2/fmu family ribosome biogenesis protein